MNRHEFFSALPFMCPFSQLNQHYEEFVRSHPYKAKNNNSYCMEFSNFLQHHYSHVMEDAFIIFEGSCCVMDDRDEQHFFFNSTTEASDPAQMKAKLILIKLNGRYLSKALERKFFSSLGSLEGNELDDDPNGLVYSKASKSTTTTTTTSNNNNNSGTSSSQSSSSRGEPAKKKRKNTVTIVSYNETNKDRIQLLDQCGLIQLNQTTKNYELHDHVFILCLVLDATCYLIDHTAIEKITKPILATPSSNNSTQKDLNLSKGDLLIDDEVLKEAERIYKDHLQKNGKTEPESELLLQNSKSNLGITSSPQNEEEKIPYLGITSSFVTLRLYHLMTEYEPQSDNDKISTIEQKISSSKMALDQALALMLKCLKPVDANIVINLSLGVSQQNHSSSQPSEPQQPQHEEVSKNFSKYPSLAFKQELYHKWNNYSELMTHLKHHPVILNINSTKKPARKWLQTEDDDIYYRSLTDIANLYSKSVLKIKSHGIQHEQLVLKRLEANYLASIENLCKLSDMSTLDEDALENLDHDIGKLREIQETLLLCDRVVPNKPYSY
ncbi:hypothetical protein C9374_008762 [Naegleria lovaniensis]|uniref:Uncharacterized protein n=1 Tax=Naegleria lovaniensis TaxID=51637 RepID=A0AA88GJW3_NAELO|nr:uncharacterized protein C9374_008762 [Naegleria lovaniensis]KAG2378140.1 hypothetical protein C9374_008762 [Naegleria lovaniensis]